MAGSLSSINIKFAVDLKQFSTEMQNSMRTIKKQGETFKNIGSSLSTFVTLPLLAAGGASLKFASDYEESLNKVDVAFKSSSESVKTFAKDTLNAFGIAEGSALEMASLFGDMSVSMGLSESEAAKMSTSLVGLAGDLASFKNIGIDQASNALKSIFTGETESLKNLGIVMTEANLQQFALSQGYKGSVKDLTEASKVQLRYNYVLEKTKNAQGDFERTGGGAANQTRIFTESLKQIGQQIGSIILPYFTKVITLVNEKVKAFSNLSEATKTTIVVIGGIVGVLGPLALAIGTIMTLVPSMIAGFVALKASFLAFSGAITTFISANPLTVMAAALALVVYGIYQYSKASSDAVIVSRTLNSVREEAAKSIAKEKAELDTLLKIAQNETLSKKERQAAIDRLNQISPEYLGNLTLEKINTDAAKEAILKYNDALNKRALAQAILAKKTELFNKQIELQERDLSMNGNAFSDAAQSASNYIFSLLGVETQVIKNRAELERYIKASKLSNEQAKAVRSAYEPLIQAREKEITTIDKQIAALDNYNASNASVVTSNSDVEKSTTSLTSAKNELAKATEKVYKAGTIAFYENEISKLKALQSEATLTRREYLLLGQQIDGFQSKIDAINAPLEPIKVTMDNVQFLKATEDNVDYFQQQVDRIAEEGQRFLADRDAENAALLEKANQTKEAYGIIGQSFVDIFGSFSQGFVDSLNIADEGMKGFVSSLIGTITKLISMALSASLANSIQGATQSAVATGPGAVFAQPAFVATAIAGIIAAFASIPKFETGGIVGGSSYTGDKILARLNSGELILNQKQQSGLFGMLTEGGQNVNIGLDGAFKLTGSDLELVIERAINRNSRKR